jgi:hypothetical protein
MLALLGAHHILHISRIRVKRLGRQGRENFLPLPGLETQSPAFTYITV